MAKCKQCGRRGIGLKLHDGLCVECISDMLTQEKKQKSEAIEELDKIRASLTPEMNNAIELEKLIRNREKEVSSLEETIAKHKQDINQRTTELENLNRQILVADETIEMESFSLYKPRYDFASSEQYKSRLESVRDAQKQMIKNKTATVVPTNWVVNDSKTEGKKMVADNVKLFLRSFNNECDIAISAVKFKAIPHRKKCQIPPSVI